MLWRAVYLHAAGRQPGTQRTDRPWSNAFCEFIFKFWFHLHEHFFLSLMLFECYIHIVKLFMTVVILRWKRANSWKEWQRLFSASAKTQRAHFSLTKSTHFHHKTIKNWEWKFDSERLNESVWWQCDVSYDDMELSGVEILQTQRDTRMTQWDRQNIIFYLTF